MTESMSLQLTEYKASKSKLMTSIALCIICPGFNYHHVITQTSLQAALRKGPKWFWMLLMCCSPGKDLLFCPEVSQWSTGNMERQMELLESCLNHARMLEHWSEEEVDSRSPRASDMVVSDELGTSVHEIRRLGTSDHFMHWIVICMVDLKFWRYWPAETLFCALSLTLEGFKQLWSFRNGACNL